MVNSSSFSHQFKYDVFLNFHGEDTRTTFVDHLYHALVQNGITTFKDDDKEESDASLKAIVESRSAIVIFSKSCGSSSWFLDELVKIMECSKGNGQIVFPVYYYDFNPSNLRRQGTVFGELFGKYEVEKVRAWTSALVEAANLSGLDLIHYRYQAKHIKEIVEMVLSKLKFKNLNFNKNAKEMMQDKSGDTTPSHEMLVGIEGRMEQVKSLLEVKTVKTGSKYELASSSPRSTKSNYDVFMCFKGNDSCKNFADQLLFALKHQGINAFSNNQGFARDASFASENIKAIEKSSIAVVIFSKKYATASCYLDELVIIMNCIEEYGQIVLPVFYDVEASDMQNVKRLFGEDIMQNKPEKVKIWRKALAKASSLAGWYLNGTPKSHEASVIESIVDVISRKMVCLPPSVDDNLIGIELRMQLVISLLELESGGVHLVGIWGMGGIGKTTIARAVFDQVSICFYGSCFLENIREVSKKNGLEHMQKEMLSKLVKTNNLHITSVYEGTNLIRDQLIHHKVLVVLDDVDDTSLLEALAGARNWFGEGSRIIITTRDENVLVAHNIVHNYNVKALDDNESSEFLKRHAFKKDALTKGYEDILPQVVSYAAGLPLALKVLSFLLCGKSTKEWIDTLARLEAFPDKNIQDKLKTSFDILDDDSKNIFLDVACFFNGMHKDRVVRILDSCGFSGDNGIRLLEQKSLIYISKEEECIKMHHLLEKMGQDIVRQMHPDEPGKHSRLWHAEEVTDVLMDKTGTKAISAIVVDDMHDQDAVDMTEAFRGMENLRLLQIHSKEKLRFLQEFSYLPNDLRWLTWEYYPLQSLPASFEANRLVALELVHSNITELHLGDKYLGTLHYLDLSYSTKLIKTPDFTKTPNLVEIKLERCTSLKKVHQSIGSLKRLTILNLSSCENLPNLPLSILQLSSLTYLNLDGCSNLKFTRLTIQVSPMIDHLNYLVGLDLRGYNLLSLQKSLCIINHQRGFPLHKTLVNMVRELRVYENMDVEHHILGSASDHSVLSESETSRELIEYKKEKLPFLPQKGV